MLNTEDDKYTYFDPYIKQHSLKDISNPSYHEYDEILQNELENQNSIFDYSHYIDNIRYKRQGDGGAGDGGGDGGGGAGGGGDGGGGDGGGGDGGGGDGGAGGGGGGDGGGGDGGGGDGGGGDGGGGDEVKEYEMFLTPLYVITAIFAAMLIIGPFLVKKGPNRGIVQACIMLAAFCMWIFWFTIYFGQMNPLMGPRLENTTVAWIAYKLGNPISPPPSPSTTTAAPTSSEAPTSTESPASTEPPPPPPSP